jgi:hypothetical protein
VVKSARFSVFMLSYILLFDLANWGPTNGNHSMENEGLFHDQHPSVCSNNIFSLELLCQEQWKLLLGKNDADYFFSIFLQAFVCLIEKVLTLHKHSMFLDAITVAY